MICPKCKHALDIYVKYDQEYITNIFYFLKCRDCDWNSEYFDSIPELKHYFKTHYERSEQND